RKVHWFLNGPDCIDKVDKCFNDYDCPGEKKCCPARCGLRCVELNEGDL
uniref:WAP domain-containing protein n=1 Tax=Gouania willdenowi TaxID=441366 RepID=A0A8C5DAD0_GOUWI